jgi:hypothetical protein
LADVILGGFWTATILEERESISLRYQFETLEAPRTETRFYDCRHDSLACLAWLIEGWPESRGEHRSGDALARLVWLCARLGIPNLGISQRHVHSFCIHPQSIRRRFDQVPHSLDFQRCGAEVGLRLRSFP